MWDWLKPIAEYGSPPGAGGAPPPIVAEYLQALCGKRLSATNPTVAYKNHMNCIKCKEVRGEWALGGGGGVLQV